MKYVILDDEKPIVMFDNENVANAFTREFEKVCGDSKRIHVEQCRELEDFYRGES